MDPKKSNPQASSPAWTQGEAQNLPQKAGEENKQKFRTVDINSFQSPQQNNQMPLMYNQMSGQMPFYNMMPQMNVNFMMPNTQPKNNYVKEFISIENYSDFDAIKKAFPACSNFNNDNFDPETIKKAEFYIIRSTNDDDLHKAIKYGIWASSYRNNQSLHHAFVERRRENVPIYLFFT